MPKRAAIIITDEDVNVLFCDDGETMLVATQPSEQLLADLAWILGAADRAIERAEAAGEHTAALLLKGAVARVRALLPKEDS